MVAIKIFEMDFWNTFGHETAKKILHKQITQGQLANAYLFLGAEHLGKRTLALEFASKVLLTQINFLFRHPDFILMEEEGEIKIEKIRELIARLSLSASSGKHKIAIINNAQNLNIQSSNALLKTLEEPSGRTVLILISSQRLLPTIQSRCQILHFNRLTEKQILNFVSLLGIDSSIIKKEKVFGRPGVLNIPEQGGSEINFQDFIKLSRADKLIRVSDWAQAESSEIQGRLQSWLFSVLVNLKEKPEHYSAAAKIMESQQNIRNNFNKKLVLQKLFLSI